MPSVSIWARKLLLGIDQLVFTHSDRFCSEVEAARSARHADSIEFTGSQAAALLILNSFKVALINQRPLQPTIMHPRCCIKYRALSS